MNREYSKEIRDCKNDNYKEIVDYHIKNGISYEKIITSLGFLTENAYNGFKYFYNKYMCYNCRKLHESKILSVLASNPPSKWINLVKDTNIYCNLLEELFNDGIYPDQVCTDKSDCCNCKKKHICYTEDDCDCLYHCDDTSFFKAIWRDCNYDFIKIGLKYIDPSKNSILFQNNKINKNLLKRYIKFIKSSDDKQNDYRTLKLFYNFYKTNCDKDITYENFFNEKLDTVHNCCNCEKEQILDKIKILECTILDLKNKL
jgi:hypothetical protein